VLVFAVALSMLIVVSQRTGPSFAEVARQSYIEQAELVVLAVAEQGPGALSSSSARKTYQGFGETPGLPLLLSGWSKLSVGRVGLLDPLTAIRLPWLALCALVPVLLFAMGRASGAPFTGVLAAALISIVPSFLHASVVGAEGAVVAAGWLLVAYPYVRSLLARSARARCFWSLSGAAALGLGMAFSPMTVYILPILLVHAALREPRATLAALRSGRGAFIPVPLLFLALLLATPLVLFLSSPALWVASSPTDIVRVALAPLGAEVTPGFYRGELVTKPSVPLGFGLTWASRAVPLAYGALALFALLGSRALRDKAHMLLLAGLALVATILVPGLLPRVLTRFPPLVEVALPWLALAAAAGLSVVAPALVGQARSRYVAGALVVVLSLASLRQPGTYSEAASALFGGARGVSGQRLLPSGDGSELGVMASRIDALARPELRVHGAAVPVGYFDVLRELGRLETRVEPASADNAEAALVRGAGSGARVLARVSRDGASLWTLEARE
jgi:hypothetical protein